MSLSLSPLANPIKRDGPVVLCILDGYGIQSPKANPEGDAIVAANPETINGMIAEAKERGLYTELAAHGHSVGLPDADDMGNSEVGHNAMGAGQVVAQGAKLVNVALEDGSMFSANGWTSTVKAAAAKKGRVHFFGLLSDGNIHSHIDQLEGMVKGAARESPSAIFVHPLIDGRDVPPTSGLIYIAKLEAILKAVTEETGVPAMIASGGGRMHCVMDRYGSNWSIVERGYNHIVHGKVDEAELVSGYKGYYTSAEEAITHARELFPEKQDQFNPPFVCVDADNKPLGPVRDGDAVVNFNFRGDRAVQITKAFEAPEGAFDHFDRGVIPACLYAGILEYDSEAGIPKTYLCPPPSITRVLSEYLCAAEKKCYAIAETHKYGHVTYFFNGNRSGYINEEIESYNQIVSEPNEMIEGHPEMMAEEVTVDLVAAIESGKWDFVRVNYANPDMVGHTGNFDSEVRCVKFLDQCMKRVLAAVEKMGGVLMLTADHGNGEEMMDKKGKPKTSHTTGAVPFAIFDPKYQNEYKVDTTGIETPGIASIASVTMNLLGYKQPEFYEPSVVTLE
ncbi:phosphoglycerate mutase, 2,3-bisphosphoglycerate-independent [Kipferlia bialata]|uniref:phosphoglycerate mutase (2,3-diphosphoglycerate-independent) n=1 Tax=Kipferlia bialata TaxID=797122 RepID=A0A9K3GLJ1_9EUKA|nr:phosphoglycerate mutase, 2,3-bisphosphoglycerate-independent [Kipferlia bialata]|eukprot:g8530.t1